MALTLLTLPDSQLVTYTDPATGEPATATFGSLADLSMEQWHIGQSAGIETNDLFNALVNFIDANGPRTVFSSGAKRYGLTDHAGIDANYGDFRFYYLLTHPSAIQPCSYPSLLRAIRGHGRTAQGGCPV